MLVQRNGLGNIAARENRADIHARKERALRIREFGAERNRTGIRADRNALERQLARDRVHRAVLKHDLHRRGAVGKLLQTAGGEFLTQLQELGSRPLDVHIDRIELMNHRHALRLISRHQGARRHFGNRYTAGNRSPDVCVLNIDLSVSEGRAGSLHGSFISTDLGLSRIVRLLRNRVLLHQGSGTGRVGAGERKRCLSLGERRLGALHIRVIDRRVNLIKRLTGLHHLSFGKQPLLQHAVYLRTDFGDPVGHRTA